MTKTIHKIILTECFLYTLVKIKKNQYWKSLEALVEFVFDYVIPDYTYTYNLVFTFLKICCFYVEKTQICNSESKYSSPPPYPNHVLFHIDNC